MNLRFIAATLSLAAFAGCAATPEGAEDPSGTGDLALTDAQGRVWRRLGDAPVSHRVATESPDPAALRRPSRLRTRVPAGASVLDVDDGEFVATSVATRVASSVAAYDRTRREGAPVRRQADSVPDPHGLRRNIQGFSDGRTRVSTGSLDNAPYKYIGRYEIPVSAGSISTCTGTLIGDRYVAIAAHCVYDRHDDAWLYGYDPSAADYRGRFCIDGVCSYITGRKINGDWSGAGDLHFREHDYAMLKLTTSMGVTNGTMGLSSITDDGTVRDLDARNHGYPGEPPDGSAGSATNLWGMHCDFNAVYSGRLAYNCDTTPGHSGGPVYYYNSNGTYYMLAVHSGPNAFDNTGARVSTVRSWFIDGMAGW